MAYNHGIRDSVRYRFTSRERAERSEQDIKNHGLHVVSSGIDPTKSISRYYVDVNGHFRGK